MMLFGIGLILGAALGVLVDADALFAQMCREERGER